MIFFMFQLLDRLLNLFVELIETAVQVFGMEAQTSDLHVFLFHQVVVGGDAVP